MAKAVKLSASLKDAGQIMENLVRMPPQPHKDTASSKDRAASKAPQRPRRQKKRENV